MDISDPLRTLELEEGDDGEDLFKSEFNGAMGRIKITAQTGEEKTDIPKPVADIRSPEDEEGEDLFSDARSEASEPVSAMPVPPGEPSIRERLNLGRRSSNEAAEETLEVTVADPHKVGDGMSSYMAYRVTTLTNLHCFRRGSFAVVRRYSDFLGLHEKLVARYQSRGRIIPPAPEKSLLGTTRVKMGGAEGGEEGPGQTKAHFISLRRGALERFINRVALHPVLR